MTTKKGYLLPDEVAPSDLDCVTFFFPDDPAYKRALITAYEHFCQWTAWEKDGTNRAVLAANAWKEARDFTHEANYMAIINITNETSCCSGCGGGNSDVNNISFNPTINNETSIDDEPQSNDNSYSETGGNPLPPEDYVDEFPDWTSFNDQKCRAANFFADKLIFQFSFLRNIFDGFLDTAIGRIMLAIGMAFSDGFSPVMDSAAVAILVIPSLRLWIVQKSGDVTELSNFVLNMDKQTMVGIIYDADTRGGLGNAMGDYLSGVAAGVSLSPVFNEWIDALIDYAFRGRFANFVFDNISNLVPSDYPKEFDCTAPAANVFVFDFASDLQGFVDISTDSRAIVGHDSYFFQDTGSMLMDVSDQGPTTFTYQAIAEYTFPTPVQYDVAERLQANVWLRLNNLGSGNIGLTLEVEDTSMNVATTNLVVNQNSQDTTYSNQSDSNFNTAIEGWEIAKVRLITTRGNFNEVVTKQIFVDRLEITPPA